MLPTIAVVYRPSVSEFQFRSCNNISELLNRFTACINFAELTHRVVTIDAPVLRFVTAIRYIAGRDIFFLLYAYPTNLTNLNRFWVRSLSRIPGNNISTIFLRREKRMGVREKKMKRKGNRARARARGGSASVDLWGPTRSLPGDSVCTYDPKILRSFPFGQASRRSRWARIVRPGPPFLSLERSRTSRVSLLPPPSPRRPFPLTSRINSLDF